VEIDDAVIDVEELPVEVREDVDADGVAREPDVISVVEVEVNVNVTVETGNTEVMIGLVTTLQALPLHEVLVVYTVEVL
jgi:hypothetical protein